VLHSTGGINSKLPHKTAIALAAQATYVYMHKLNVFGGADLAMLPFEFSNSILRCHLCNCIALLLLL
jgi:hypothetical protein